MDFKFRGRALKFGHNIDAEQILPSRYTLSARQEEVVPHVMSGADPHIGIRLKKGDIIVAGTNFGCGSALEIVPLALKWAGVAAVIAESFSRVFYRNAINIGFPILEGTGVYAGIGEGDMVEIDLERGLIRSITKMRNFPTAPFPDFMQTLMHVGGLEEYVRQRLKRASTAT
ncbi:MAG: 3-isopropylmalate dehydratase small subunit [Acidobacteria bacterium]|nr:3-isopropylmalate dehydratase small subunit [Acidobacteriota bacterium]